MQIKRFEAENMAAALRLVKQEFGSEAVILSARSLEKKMGLFSMKRPGVEVTAAKDTICPEAKETQLNKVRKLHQNQSVRSNLGDSNKKKSPVRSLYGKVNALKNVRNNYMVKKNHAPQNHARELFALYKRMSFQGVEENIAMDLIEKINRIASSENVLKNKEVKSYLIDAFKKTGLSASPIKIEQGKQKIVVFVGPSGVGKTTTVAKLAFAHALRMKDRVALITLDNYRIAAVEQLKIYAKIIGISIEVASTGKEFKKCLNRLKDKDLILIDTPGISQKDEYQFNELRNFFDKVRHIETHLLLSATTKENDLIDILARFKVFPISKLLFTKLDESTSYGNMLNPLIQSKIPVSYFTNGQQVPEDIEIATLNKLADLMTDREKGGGYRFFSQKTLNNKEREKTVSINDDWMNQRSKEAMIG